MLKISLLAALFGLSTVVMLVTETQAQSLSISGTGISVTKPQCANGKDDADGEDTRADLSDPGCKNSLDNDERNSTASIASLAVSATLLSSSQSLADEMGPPRDIDCSAFGKGGGNPDKYEAIVRCIITPLEVIVRCINNGDGSLSASSKSVHVNSETIGGEIRLDSDDVTGRGLWAATVLIPGSELLPLITQLSGNTCPNAKNWTILPATFLIKKATVMIQTSADDVLKDEEDLGTCTLNADLETYTCRL